MLGIYLIGLREGLEAALIVSIICSYVVKIGRRDVLPRVAGGILAAVVLALGVGALLFFGAQTLTFEAQEALGGGLSIVAVGFVTWMIFWMTRRGRGLSSEIRSDVDRSLLGGGWSIALLAFLTVGREGVETSLFIWSAAQGATRNWVTIAAAVGGILTAVLLGVLISKGLVRINFSRFFTITGAFLILVAAGVLSYGVHDLQEARVLPGLLPYAYDLSALVAPGNVVGAVLIGALLKGFVNFSVQATWLEIAAWVLYVAIVGTAFVRSVRSKPVPDAARTPVAAIRPDASAVPLAAPPAAGRAITAPGAR